MSYVYTEYHVKLNGEKVTWLEVDVVEVVNKQLTMHIQFEFGRLYFVMVTKMKHLNSYTAVCSDRHWPKKKNIT